MSGDHDKYCMKVEVVKPELTYDSETGEPLIDGYPMYSGLPKREWVDLTEDDIQAILKEWVQTQMTVREMLREAEAKLKQLNA
jgi:hypothetical protein